MDSANPVKSRITFARLDNNNAIGRGNEVSWLACFGIPNTRDFVQKRPAPEAPLSNLLMTNGTEFHTGSVFLCLDM